ncbi:MAG: hypothetical protein QHC40_11085 [Sphingobium sp.]|nr:hypothetical protein [Sphingobium sp.]
MFDPMGSWTDWNRMATVMMRNGIKMGEAWGASGRVIDHRLGLIRTDMASAAAQAELLRMVPEKMEAFSLSGMAATMGWWAWQGEMLRIGQQMALAMMRMQPPTLRAARASTARSQAAAGRLARAATGAIAPIHKTVTANDRRLRKR